MTKLVSRQPTIASPKRLWAATTELVGIQLDLKPQQDGSLYPQYTIGLHAWLLDQVRQHDPDLSAQLHDDPAEKPFTISGLNGIFLTQGNRLTLSAEQHYQWQITALSRPVATWLRQWAQAMPATVDLRDNPLEVQSWQISQAATTYKRLQQLDPVRSLSLSFLSPTSFRRKKHHFPLPVPANVFQSYLRRWLIFSGQEIDQDAFLDWVESTVIISHHQLASCKVVAGKQGAVTGFTGVVTFNLTGQIGSNPAFEQLFTTLGAFAPYCGTGHKTTFGLGQTQLGWSEQVTSPPQAALDQVLADRITALTHLFRAQRQRTGGDRATHIAETWATILARRELGESLQTIAADLEMPYETVKTYAKRARAEERQLKREEGRKE